MLLICVLLSVTVGLANTSVNEPVSDEVIFIDNAVIGINNVIEYKNLFGVKKIDNYASIEKVRPIKLKAYSVPFFYNTDIVLLADNCEGGRSPPERVVKNLQPKGLKSVIKTDRINSRERKQVFYIKAS